MKAEVVEIRACPLFEWYRTVEKVVSTTATGCHAKMCVQHRTENDQSPDEKEIELILEKIVKRSIRHDLTESGEKRPDDRLWLATEKMRPNEPGAR